MDQNAGFFTRCCAFSLDLLLLAVLKEGILLFWPSSCPYPWLGVLILYFTFWTGYSGQTLGKWVLGLKVTDPWGLYPVGYARAFLRTLGYLINLLAWGWGFLWIIGDREKRGWHDLLAKTRVCRC